MANFSVNQCHHLYVAKDYVDGVTKSALTDECDIEVKKVENELYFLYKGADGVIKSDFIPLNNITYAYAIDAADNGTKLKKVSIALNSNINSGAPVAGQDYILGINFKNFFSSGDASQYYKDAAVHVTSAIATASAFYKAMVVALNRAFSREDNATLTSNPYLKFKIGYSTSSESEEGDANWAGATATKIIIEEKEQDWVLGTMPQRRALFDVFPGTIYTGGDDVIWAAQNATTGEYFTAMTGPTVGNGKKIADLEWFCCGERGDQYRNMGYPNVIPTKYYVEPDKEYHLIEFHFAFTDTGVNSYRTEKELTIVVPNGASDHEYDVVNGIIGKINAAAGTTLITTLS